MEQKKILWIIASVGVFLLVVMGAALIINRPTQGVEPSLASLQSNNDTWVMPPISEPPVHATDAFQTEGELVDGEVTNNALSTHIAQDSTVGSMTVYSGNTTVSGVAETTTIDLNSIKEGGQQSAVTAKNQAGAAAVASKSTISAKAPASEATKPISGTTKAATSNKSTTSSSNKVQDQYWVQVASVTNKNNAENARAALAANKIESEIFTHKADDGRLYYRLRVGPYTTKTEAEYWKGRIALIDEFSNIDSFITNTAAKK